MSAQAAPVVEIGKFYVDPAHAPAKALRIHELPHGLHEGYPEALYHEPRLDLASSTGLKLLGQDSSPAHFRAWVQSGGREETDALVIGRAVHCLMLEPERFARDYAVMPDLSDNGEYRTKASKERRDAWIAARNGAPVLDEKKARQVRAMCEAILEHPLARVLLEGGASEVTARGKDAGSGVECKARLDHWNPNLFGEAVIADLKSTDDASARGFTKTCETYGYPLQEDLYRRILSSLGRPSGFRFVVAEKAPPYGVAVYRVAEASLAKAYEVNSRRLELLAKCVESNTWPGYAPGIHEIEPRVWQ